jgi:hypothetical protein
MKALKITVEGTVEQVDFPYVHVAELQRVVGGMLEERRIDDDIWAYIDEESKLKGLPLNVLATALCHTKQCPWLASDEFIGGTMLCIGSPDSEGNETDVPFNLEYNLSVLARRVADQSFGKYEYSFDGFIRLSLQSNKTVVR